MRTKRNADRVGKKVKYYGSTEYVDINTGLIITHAEFQRGNYRRLNLTETTEFKRDEYTNQIYGITKRIWTIREHEQQRLF